MPADVAEGRGAEERIADGVQKNVCIGVAGEAFLVRNGDAADDELAVRDQRMHIETLPDSHWRLFRMLSAMARSSGQVTFRFSRLPATSLGLRPICSIALASSVTAPRAVCS